MKRVSRCMNAYIISFSNHFYFSFRDIIKHPQLLMPFVDLFAALCGNGMLESMLEPHLRETGASTLDVGLSFLIFGCCYMLGNMFFGQVKDFS